MSIPPSPDPTAPRIDVSILTGFLGSGKTTLLNAMLRDPAMAGTAVLINEFGSVGLDHLLVESASEALVLLDSGCICCAIEDDLAAALDRLLASRAAGRVPPFDRIVIETSGVADPGPIVQLLLGRSALDARLRLARIVTIVDAALGAASLAAYPECLNQVAMADLILISKRSLASADAVAGIERRVASLAPDAAIVPLEDITAKPARFLGAGGIMPRQAAPVASRHRERYKSFTLDIARPLRWDRLIAWLEGLLSARGNDILRVKGWAWIEGSNVPVLLQCVQHMVFTPERLTLWPNGRPETRLVFITTGFTEKAAMQSLAPFR